MADGETLVAHRRVDIDPEPVEVRISTHDAEGFWRVQVAYCSATRQVSTTTVGGDDTFMWPLVRAAVDGDGPAWQHLAHWGHGAMRTRLKTAG